MINWKTFFTTLAASVTAAYVVNKLNNRKETK